MSHVMPRMEMWIVEQLMPYSTYRMFNIESNVGMLKGIEESTDEKDGWSIHSDHVRMSKTVENRSVGNNAS